MTMPYAQNQVAAEPKKKSWFLRHKILTGIGVIAIAAAIGTSAGGKKNDSSTDAGTSDNQVSVENPTTAAQAAEANNAATQANEPKAATGKTRDNSSAQLTTLGAGTFTVGQDVAPGRYVITCPEGESGNISASSAKDPLALNEILGTALGLGVPSVTTDLTDGEEIKISGLSAVTFTPATTELRTSLSAGDWEVGLDVEAGNYIVTPAAGESGNFALYSKSGFPETIEILGDAGGLGVPNVTVELEDGQKIAIAGLSEVTFTKK